jgi:transcriptional regulator with GAF, ATPase, and Fis domain
MNDTDKTREQLLEEIRVLRRQVEHLTSGNQKALIALEKRTTELQALNTIGQATALGTDLASLFRAVHEETEKIMGTVNFTIALYDEAKKQIEITYAFEDGRCLQMEPFPLGEDLTSIVIRTRQPLLLVQDTEKRTRELRARGTGSPAKSWLGVPLIFAGDILGAIIVQDREKGDKFSEDDLRLLSTLANQVGASMRYLSLLEDLRCQAEHERITSEISAKVWSSARTDTILRTAIRELCQSWDASEGLIMLELEDELPVAPPNGD